MRDGREPPILPGCSVLSPMEVTGHQSGGDQGADKAQGKPNSRGRGSRFADFNAFVDFTMRDLPRAEALVWLVLFRDTKPDGLVRTSQADLARRVGAHVCTIKRAVPALRARGLLTVVFRGSLRRGPSTYRVHPLTKDTVKGASTLPN
jgi:hypothetical protein